jgi:hypothetical protein
MSDLSVLQIIRTFSILSRSWEVRIKYYLSGEFIREDIQRYETRRTGRLSGEKSIGEIDNAKRFLFKIIYEIREDTIIVIAVDHISRDRF